MTNDDLGPDLPLELIQAILIHLPKVHYLTQTALVNLAFYQSTIPLLYNRVSINPWYEKKSKVYKIHHIHHIHFMSTDACHSLLIGHSTVQDAFFQYKSCSVYWKARCVGALFYCGSSLTLD